MGTNCPGCIGGARLGRVGRGARREQRESRRGSPVPSGADRSVERVLDVTRDGMDSAWAGGRLDAPRGCPVRRAVAREIGAAAAAASSTSGGLSGWDSAPVTFAYALAEWRGSGASTWTRAAFPRRTEAPGSLSRARRPPATPHPRRRGRRAHRARGTRGAAGLGHGRRPPRLPGADVLALVAFLRGRAASAASTSFTRSRPPAALGIVALVVSHARVLGGGRAPAVRAAMVSLVGIGVARELGPIMTGIVMTGRTGAPLRRRPRDHDRERGGGRPRDRWSAAWSSSSCPGSSPPRLPALVAYADVMDSGACSWA